jgi:pyrroline-5-carboxylate reductase
LIFVLKNEKMLKTAILGCGNLGQSIARGICQMEGFKPQNLILSKRNLDELNPFAIKGVRITQNNRLAVEEADIILLALKPYNIESVINEIQPLLKNNQKIISLAAGLSLEQLSKWLNNDRIRIYRAMPNTATAVNSGLIGIAAPFEINQDEDDVVSLFLALGEVLVLDEALLESVTILGACGIAFVMRFMRAMEQGGIQIGFDAKTAAKIVQHTVYGASSLLINNGSHPEQEIDKVTTPKGCTIVGLNQMEHAGFSSALIRGIVKSYDAI